MASPFHAVRTGKQRPRCHGLSGMDTAPTRWLTRARLRLTAHHGEDDPGWCDAALARGLATDPNRMARGRHEGVTEGSGAVAARTRSNCIAERHRTRWKRLAWAFRPARPICVEITRSQVTIKISVARFLSVLLLMRYN